MVGDEPGFRWPFFLPPFDAEEELRAPAPGGVFARAGALEPVLFAAADVASPRAASLGCGLLGDLLRFPWFAAVSSSACSAFTTRSASSCVMAGSSSMRAFPVAKFPSACVRCVSSSSTWRESFGCRTVGFLALNQEMGQLNVGPKGRQQDALESSNRTTSL